jgi:hypothetical protein
VDPINVNRWQNKVRAFFGMRGGNPVETLKELVPVVVVENDRIEFRGAGNEWTWGAGTQVAAGGVGNFARVGIHNPAGSGVIVVVESITICNNTGASLNMQGGSILTETVIVPGVSSLCRPRDARVFGQQAAGRIVTNNASATAITLAVFDVQVLPATAFTWRDEYVVPPGFILWSGSSVANNASGLISYCFRERPLERGLLS